MKLLLAVALNKLTINSRNMFSCLDILIILLSDLRTPGANKEYFSIRQQGVKDPLVLKIFVLACRNRREPVIKVLNDSKVSAYMKAREETLKIVTLKISRV